MRLTVTVDEALLEEARRLAGTRTKREALELALREFVRRRGLVAIQAHAGAVDLALTVEDLLKAREES